MRTYWTIAYKESAQMLRSQRGLLWLLAFSGLLSAFSLLLVSNTELSLLDNAQVVYMMSGTILAAGALLAAILGSDAYAGERERGTLVPLLCAPIAPNALLAGKAMGLLAAWGVMFGVATPYLWAVGASGQNLGAAVFYLAFFRHTGSARIRLPGHGAVGEDGQCFDIVVKFAHLADAGRKPAIDRSRPAR
jgi:ABC-type transport system involved in multi-copper enzyme maturation, permease component